MAPFWYYSVARVSSMPCLMVTCLVTDVVLVASGKEYETFRCADLYPIVYGMQYMDERGCSYQQFKDEADLVRCVETLFL